MIGDNNRPEPNGNDGFRARNCDIFSSFILNRNLNHRQRTLLGAILLRAQVSLNLAKRFYEMQDDFKPLRTRYELRQIYKKRFALPRCSTLFEAGLCKSYCGGAYPDITLCRRQISLYSGVFFEPTIPNRWDGDTARLIKDYYLHRFTAPETIDCKFRFFKVETPEGWIKIKANRGYDLTNAVRRIAVHRLILGVYRSLGRFVSAKWAEKSGSYVLIGYTPVLDYDLHRQLKETVSYDEQNEMLASLLKEKVRLLKERGYTPRRILFTGGGFHFYLEMSMDEARKLAKETGADLIIDHKRVVRIEKTLNVRYGDIRICSRVSDDFNLYNHILARRVEKQIPVFKA